MDFKDILDRWDALEKKATEGCGAERARSKGIATPQGGKKANAPLPNGDAITTRNSPALPPAETGREKSTRNPPAGGANAALEAWLAGHGTLDKDSAPSREDTPLDIRSPKRVIADGDASTTGKYAGAVLASWLATHGVMDKDAEAGGSGDDARKGAVSGREMSIRPPQARIDLHGLNAEDAEQALKVFLAQCSRRGLENVLVVHGKGNHSAEGPILAGVVRRVLESNPVAGSHGSAHRSLGGRGATWVRIRKTDYFSR